MAVDRVVRVVGVATALSLQIDRFHSFIRLLFIYSEIGQNGGLPFCVVSARTMQFPAQSGKSLFRNSEYGYRRMVEPANIDLVFRFQSVEYLVGFPFLFILSSVHGMDLY